MKADFILVGDGIAGSLLAYTLINCGCKVILLGNAALPAASHVAAGIVNPVTGKRLSKTWQADALFTFLTPFYRRMETVLGATFFHDMPVYRIFTSMEEQNTWYARTALPEYSRFVRIPDRLYSDYINQPFGGLEITESGYLDIPVMLGALRAWLQEQGSWQPASFACNQLEIARDQVSWQDITAGKIIFCEGPSGGDNPWFNWLPFRPVKGELLTIRIPGAQLGHIINQHMFVIPLQEKQQFRAGATYEWKDLSWTPTPTAQNELVTRLSNILRVPFEILDHKAGVRPATSDRRPFVGIHPRIPELGIFNGLGTKGASLAPYYAQQFAGHLINDKQLDSEVHIDRFNSLYYLSK